MLLYILHTHIVKKQKSIEPYTNACCGYTLPAALHICASTRIAHWDGESSPMKGGGGEHGLQHRKREWHCSQREKGDETWAKKKKIQTV